MTTLTITDFVKRPEFADKEFKKGTAFTVKYKELRSVMRNCTGILLDKKLLSQVRHIRDGLLKKENSFTLSTDEVRDISNGFIKDGAFESEDEQFETQAAMSAGAAAVIVVAVAVVLAGSFALGVAVGWAAGDLGEDEEGSVTISTDEGEIGIELD